MRAMGSVGLTPLLAHTPFNVPDFREVIPEAFELVEKGFVMEHEFPGIHVHQRRPPAHAQQPGCLQA